VSRLQLVLLASAIGITILILVFSRILFMPLRRLTAAAVQIEKGSFEATIPQFPLDEIGQLARVLNSVVSQLTNRIRQMRSAVQVSRASALSFDVNQMLSDLANTLTDQFGYPDVRIYLADTTGKRLRLQAAAGAESERLLRVGHRIPLDETNIVGRSVLLNEPLLGGGKEILRAAGLITEHSELAVPLRAGGQSLGGLHLLAGRLREFNPEDADVIRLIADQLSASIQNARLFEQSQASLREIEELNRRLTRQGWEEYVGVGSALRHTLDPEQHWPLTSHEVRKMTEIKADVLADSDGRSVLAVPLILRGEPVGSLSVTRPIGESWSRDEVLLIEAIASRMTIIAEGIRLVDESNLRAQREQQVNEISANLLQRATSVETVLRSALNELGGALGSDRISLRIGSTPARDDHQIGAGQDDGSNQEPSNGGIPGGLGDAEDNDRLTSGGNGDGGHEL
jgi:GAF domain-containing protein/HAMP domain-containing protein